MLISRDVAFTHFRVWLDDTALLRVDIRRRDVSLSFEGELVDVNEAALRFRARMGGLIFTLSLQTDFEFEYDDVPPAPEHQSTYDRGVRLFYPHRDPAIERERIVIAEIVEPQI